MGCEGELVCCRPDPRIADDFGMCVRKANLMPAGEPCGPASGACCEEGLICDIRGEEDEGICIAP
jgi:hypothetical protein